MRVGSRRWFVAVLMVAAVAVCGVARAADGSWVSFTDKSYGIRVSIPKSWHTVPPTIAGVQSLIAQLGKKKQIGLAQVYASFINTAAARKKLLGYHFQAFQYSPGVAIQPDFALGYARTPRAYTAKDLAATGKSVAKSFAAQSGTVISKQTMVNLPSGPAAFLEGTQPAANGLRSQFQVYVVAHGTLLYELSFRADSRASSEAATFASIAHRFAFV